MIIPEDVKARFKFANQDEILQLITQAEKELDRGKRILRGVIVRDIKDSHLVTVNYEQSAWFALFKRNYTVDIYADTKYKLKKVSDPVKTD